MATVDWLRMSAGWNRVGAWGIAFRGQAGSVLFFSDRPMEELDGADIAVCDETTTSVRVLEAILTGKYGLRIGNWRRNVDVSDARTPRLLIQNQAVDESQRRRFPFVYDLGREWWSWQGTPIVSAVWVHRCDLDPMLVELQRRRLEDAMVIYRGDPLLAIQKHLASERLDHSAEAIRALHHNFEYELGAESEAGIIRMREVLQQDVTGFANAAAADAAMAR
jgi:predicted solute-binding protein